MSYSVTEPIADQATIREFYKLAAVLNSIQADKLALVYVAPTKPFPGQVVICDGVRWNPIGDGVKRPIWFDGTLWKTFS